MRGSLFFLETMSYGDDAESRFEEARAYVDLLANGDPTKRDAMLKFISIGGARELIRNDVVRIHDIVQRIKLFLNNDQFFLNNAQSFLGWPPIRPKPYQSVLVVAVHFGARRPRP